MPKKENIGTYGQSLAGKTVDMLHSFACLLTRIPSLQSLIHPLIHLLTHPLIHSFITAKKEAAQAEKGRKADEQREREESAQWAKGAKDNSKAAAEAAKEEEKRRKAAEKAALIAAEEAEASGMYILTHRFTCTVTLTLTQV